MNLLDNLRSLNRKERFHLIGWALDNPRFQLSGSFRRQLDERLHLAVPEDAVVGMDYHLDWLYAGLASSDNTVGAHRYENDGCVSGTQEDVDLLIAFEERGRTHIIMLEAKGATGWTNAQLTHKAARLGAIFGTGGTRWPGVTPHFLIASPVEPTGLLSAGWPGWMAPNGEAVWLPMPMGEGLRRVARCNAAGQASVNGTHWTILRC